MTGRERFRPRFEDDRSKIDGRPEIAAVGIDTSRNPRRAQPRADLLPGLDAVGGRVFAGATLEEHLDAGAGHQHDLGVPAAERVGRQRRSVERAHLERQTPRLFLEGLQPQAIGHVSADVGETPDLRLTGLDRDAGIDLPRDGKDPPLAGVLFLPALPGRRDPLGVGDLASGRCAQAQLAAAVLSRIDLVAESVVRGSISRLGAQGKLD